MRSIFWVFGLGALAFGGWACTTIRSDIQVEIAVTAIIGGLLLLGVAATLDRLKDIQKQLAGPARGRERIQPTEPFF